MRMVPVLVPSGFMSASKWLAFSYSCSLMANLFLVAPFASPIENAIEPSHCDKHDGWIEDNGCTDRATGDVSDPPEDVVDAEIEHDWVVHDSGLTSPSGGGSEIAEDAIQVAHDSSFG